MKKWHHWAWMWFQIRKWWMDNPPGWCSPTSSDPPAHYCHFCVHWHIGLLWLVNDLMNDCYWLKSRVILATSHNKLTLWILNIQRVISDVAGISVQRHLALILIQSRIRCPDYKGPFVYEYAILTWSLEHLKTKTNTVCFLVIFFLTF